jgi:hypothetical protein
MKHPAAGVRHGLWPCPYRQVFRRLAGHAVRIAQRQPDFIRRVRLEIEDAACEHVRCNHIQPVALKDFFILKAEKRQRFFPLRFALFPIGNVHRCVAIGVAVDEPLKAEIDESGWIDQEFTGRNSVGVLRGRAGSDRTRHLQ